MGMALRLKPPITLHRNSNVIIHLFSTSSSPNNGEDSSNNSNSESPSPPQSHFKEVKESLRQSHFKEVKESLRRTPTSPQQTGPPFSSSTPSQPAGLNEILKNLSQFRSKSAPEPSAAQSPPSAKAISFQELYRRNVIQKNEGGGPNGNKTGALVDAIRENLKTMKSTQSKNRGPQVNKDIWRQTLTTSPTSSPTSSVVRGGSETSPPPSFLAKETAEGERKNDLVKSYSYDELGAKLRKLRPTDGKVIGNNWLSFKELNERLVKLREEEEREMTSSGSMFMGLRESIIKLNDKSANNNQKAQSAVRLDFLLTLGGTETFLRGDPKEHLVEKYFHPDNMSSVEKLKLELKKIRDEFKLSESDCGSSRVQVAQLTVKIKHLSSVLHKKDKHSRKGLQEMVQRRKKLLKYLRRTDWDSYCFCLSKLGLRDNPDYKN